MIEYTEYSVMIKSNRAAYNRVGVALILSEAKLLSSYVSLDKTWVSLTVSLPPNAENIFKHFCKPLRFEPAMEVVLSHGR